MTSPAGRLGPELERGRTRDVLLGLADHSPYLWALVQEDPERLVRLLEASARRRRSMRSFKRSASRRDEHEADLMPALRRAKREAALLIALADIGGVWDVVAATEALTRFADAAVRAALAFLLRKHARAGLLALDADAPDLENGCRSGRAGARQAWRARAQLFERHRPHRALRPRGSLDSIRTRSRGRCSRA